MRALTLAVLVVTSCAPGAAPAVAGSPSAAHPVASGTASPSRAFDAAALPLFDAHVHLNRGSRYTPEDAIAILTRSGVRRALVSSTPDEATFALRERASSLVVPELRPYRGPDDPSRWTADGSVVAYVEARFRRGVHRGIGEFHLAAEQASSPVVRAIVALAVREDLYLHAHADAVAIEALLAIDRRAKMLWAHAAISEPPETIARMLERHPALWVELAIRTDMAPDGRLDPTWRALLVRYPDRFLIGSDTYVDDRWERMPEIHAAHRNWLAQLAPEVAERIAYRNGERLFAP